MGIANLIGDFLLGYVVPIAGVLFIILIFTVGAYSDKKNISYNAIGFMLILISIAMGGAPEFADTSQADNFVLSDVYKSLGVFSGLFGTAICTRVAMKDQAEASKTKNT